MKQACEIYTAFIWGMVFSGAILCFIVFHIQRPPEKIYVKSEPLVYELVSEKECFEDDLGYVRLSLEDVEGQI
jgi:hypothetical protein